MLDNPNDTLQRIEITDEELDALTSAIKTRFGIDFTCYEKKSIKRGFARLIARNNLGSMVGLWSKILKDKEFLIKYIDDLLVNLTELFRNPEIWLKVKNDLLKNFEQQNVIKIWHAGCSTGEEIYTMAIVLHTLQLTEKTRILATDLSTAAIEQAKNGKYGNYLWNKYVNSFHAFSPIGNPDKYFDRFEHDFSIKSEIKKNITFMRHNLVQDPMNKKFEIIFCRNVMIYFDDKLKLKVLKLFHESLEDNGYFIIGYYDMLPEASKELFTLYDPTTRIYVKNKLKP